MEILYKGLSCKGSGEWSGSVLADCKRETKLMLGYLVVIVAAVYKGQMLQFSSPRSECHVQTQTLQDK